MNHDLTENSAVTLGALVGSRAISTLELMDACVARIGALDSAANAICTTDFERARRRPRSRCGSGPGWSAGPAALPAAGSGFFHALALMWDKACIGRPPQSRYAGP